MDDLQRRFLAQHSVPMLEQCCNYSKHAISQQCWTLCCAKNRHCESSRVTSPLWRKCHTCSRSLGFTAAHFHLALVAASISHFVTAATKFSCCSSNKKCLLCFLSLALDICRPFSRWASLACRLLSLFLCLSLALYSKFVDMTINLSLIL